jgi:hypothetical protein
VSVGPPPPQAPSTLSNTPLTATFATPVIRICPLWSLDRRRGAIVTVMCGLVRGRRVLIVVLRDHLVGAAR